MKSMKDLTHAGIHCNGTVTCNDVTAPEVWRTLIAVYLGVILFMSVTVNGTLCLVFYKKPHLLNISNCFVLNLTCCHLVLSLLILPFSFYSAVSPSSRYSGPLCEVQGYFFTVVIVSIQLSLLIISLDRNYAIMNSLRYPNVFTQSLCTVMIGTSWVVGLIISIPPLLRSGLGTFSFHPYQFICTLDWRENSAYLIAFHVFTFMLPIVVQSFCYVKIFIAALGHTKRSMRVHPWVTSSSVKTFKDMASDSSDSGESVISEEVRRDRKQCKAVRTIFIIALAYCVCWVPYLFDSYLTYTRKIYSPHLSAGSMCLVFSTSVLNPVIYAYMNRVTRREILKFLCGAPAINETDDFVSTSMSTYSSAKQCAPGWTSQQRIRSKSTGGLNEMDTIIEEAEESQICETRSFDGIPNGNSTLPETLPQPMPGCSNSLHLNVKQLKDDIIKPNANSNLKNSNGMKSETHSKDSCNITIKGKSKRLRESGWNVVHTDKFIDERRRNSRSKSENYFKKEKRRKRDFGSFLYFEKEESASQPTRSGGDKKNKKSRAQRFSVDHIQNISISSIPRLLKFRFSVSDIDTQVQKVTVRSNVEIENSHRTISVDTDELESSSCGPLSPVFGDKLPIESHSEHTGMSCNNKPNNTCSPGDTDMSPVPVSPCHVLTDVTIPNKSVNRNTAFNENTTAFEYNDVFTTSRKQITARRSV